MLRAGRRTSRRERASLAEGGWTARGAGARRVKELSRCRRVPRWPGPASSCFGRSAAARRRIAWGGSEGRKDHTEGYLNQLRSRIVFRQLCFYYRLAFTTSFNCFVCFTPSNVCWKPPLQAGVSQPKHPLANHGPHIVIPSDYSERWWRTRREQKCPEVWKPP